MLFIKKGVVHKNVFITSYSRRESINIVGIYTCTCSCMLLTKGL